MFVFERKITAWYVVIALVGLALGSLFGPLQAFEKAGLNLYPSLQSLGIKSYYQGLTLHGVLNALVWTTFFIVGFLTFATTRGLKRELEYPWLSTLGLVLMVIGQGVGGQFHLWIARQLAPDEELIDQWKASIIAILLAGLVFSAAFLTLFGISLVAVLASTLLPLFGFIIAFFSQYSGVFKE